MWSIENIFSSGITCHALSALSNIGIFNLLEENRITFGMIKKNYPTINEIALNSLFSTLKISGIVSERDGIFTFTSFGQEALKNIGEFSLWFGAYSKLYGKLEDIVVGSDSVKHSDFKGELVGKASAEIGYKKVDPILYNVLDRLNLKDKVCDLGCGGGQRLNSICDRYNVEGIGIDLNPEAIASAHFNFPNSNISFLNGDVTKLSDQFPNVELLLQTFMTHHITPNNSCVNVLNHYRDCFPNAKYFIILDTVSPEIDSHQPELFTSGFILIHGLQGLRPRTKSEMREIIKEAHYKLLEEIPLEVPNSYLWLLEI